MYVLHLLAIKTSNPSHKILMLAIQVWSVKLLILENLKILIWSV